MAHAIDTDGTRRAGSTLLDAGTAAADCTVAARRAGGHAPQLNEPRGELIGCGGASSPSGDPGAA